MTAAAGASELIARLGVLATRPLRIWLGMPLSPFAQDLLPTFLVDLRYSAVNGLALALLLVCARTASRRLLWLQALGVALALGVLPVVVMFVASELPPALGGDPRLDVDAVLTRWRLLWTSLSFWGLIVANALGLFLAARGRGRAWQGVAWAAPRALAMLAIQLALGMSVLALSTLIDLVLRALTLPRLIRRADAFLVGRADPVERETHSPCMDEGAARE